MVFEGLTAGSNIRQNAIVVESRMVRFEAVVKAKRWPRIAHSWIIRKVLSEAGVIASQGYMMKQTFMGWDFAAKVTKQPVAKTRRNINFTLPF